MLTKSFDAEVGIQFCVIRVYFYPIFILIFEFHFIKVLEKCPDIKWHFIGHMQRNKVSKVLSIPGLYVIETIDSEKLANSVNDGWKKLNKDSRLKVMVQVNTSKEDG